MDAKTQTEKLLSVRDIAKRVGVTERSVRDEIRRGRIKALRFGRQWRVEEQELYDYMRANALAAASR